MVGILGAGVVQDIDGSGKVKQGVSALGQTGGIIQFTLEEFDFQEGVFHSGSGSITGSQLIESNSILLVVLRVGLQDERTENGQNGSENQDDRDGHSEAIIHRSFLWS